VRRDATIKTMLKFFTFICVLALLYFAFIHYRSVLIVAKSEKEVRAFILGIEKKYYYYIRQERRAVRYITPRTRL
jgi:hypothetical protein